MAHVALPSLDDLVVKNILSLQSRDLATLTTEVPHPLEPPTPAGGDLVPSLVRRMAALEREREELHSRLEELAAENHRLHADLYGRPTAAPSASIGEAACFAATEPPTPPQQQQQEQQVGKSELLDAAAAEKPLGAPAEPDQLVDAGDRNSSSAAGGALGDADAARLELERMRRERDAACQWIARLEALLTGGQLARAAPGGRAEAAGSEACMEPQPALLEPGVPICGNASGEGEDATGPLAIVGLNRSALSKPLLREPVSHDAGKLLSKAEFLSRLPASVVRKGRVLPIRGPLATLLGSNHPSHRRFSKCANRPGRGPGTAAGDGTAGAHGGAPGMLLVDMDAAWSGAPQPLCPDGAPPPVAVAVPQAPSRGPARSTTMLRVKSEDGLHTYVLRLRGDTTIGEVRGFLDAHRNGGVAAAPAGGGAGGSPRGGGGGRAPRYELRSAFPARVFSDPAETLEEAGLAPSATLFIRALPTRASDTAEPFA